MNSSSLRHSWLLRAAGALLAIGAIAAIPTRAVAGVYVSVNIAPPILPVYAQPMVPGPGYLWTPGYWAWSGDGYFWVPGTWVLPPYMGALWTPGYWGWGSGGYVFHGGYWGRHVGFYGGIDYGYGYGGRGYEGGYWRGGGFYYNRSVNHVGGNIRNVYNRTVINNTTVINNRRVSFNGGPRGTAARATAQEQGWAREQHRGPVAAQTQQRTLASRDTAQRSSVNHGQPPIAATARAGAFRDHGVAAARGAPAPMTSSAAREAQRAPRAATTSNDGALRSTRFAPHGNASSGTASASRYQPVTQDRGRGLTEPSRGSSREPQVSGNRAYRPQDVRAMRAPSQAQRMSPDAARGNQRATSQRPATASRGHAAPAKQRERRGDNQHGN
ncbi:MAG: hypothetical protein ABI128_02230 [Rhodanobacter sp.]